MNFKFISQSYDTFGTKLTEIASIIIWYAKATLVTFDAGCLIGKGE